MPISLPCNLLRLFIVFSTGIIIFEVYSHMLRHRFTLLSLDLFLIGISFFLAIWIKGNPASYLTQKYLYGLILFTVIWITVSASFKKYFPKYPPGDSSSAQIVVINLLIFGIIVIIMYGARSLAYSRLVIFGTTGFLTLFELIVNKVYRLSVLNGNGTITLQGKKKRKKTLYSGQPILIADPELRARDSSLLLEHLRKDIIEECGDLAFDYISGQLDLQDPRNLVMSTTTRFNIQYQPDNYLNGVVNLKRVNDIRYINKFFEAVNTKLPEGGTFIGCAETKNLRKKRILKKFPPVINWVYYLMDYIIKRVFPKFKLTKKLYFFLTRGENRVLTRAEILGRLYSCGFAVESEEFVNGRYFFNVRKNGVPLYPKKPTFGALVRLPRIGRDGKIIYVYKMRTMHPYAEYLQKYMYEKHNLEEGGKFQNDFRVSSVGRILRVLWLDELPMVLNWLRMEIKLVGVRPLSEQYFSLYSKEHQDRRIRYKPGLVPPYYADLPKTIKEIEASERVFFDAYDRHPFRTNWRYFWKAWYNIIFKRARSR